MVRKSAFSVREVTSQAVEYTLTIAHEAFNSRRVRDHDICFLKPRRELAFHADHSPKTDYRITDPDLDDYRTAHALKPGRKGNPRWP